MEIATLKSRSSGALDYPKRSFLSPENRISLREEFAGVGLKLMRALLLLRDLVLASPACVFSTVSLVFKGDRIQIFCFAVFNVAATGGD